MTEPTAPRPVPGPPRPGAAPVAAPGGPTTGPRPTPATESVVSQSPATEVPATGGGTPPAGASAGHRLGGLEELPVSEHVAVFEAEHARLQRELGTIDPR
ncbi:hypothetical protein ACI799_14325 [Blastococcus sp. SYSU DS0753]